MKEVNCDIIMDLLPGYMDKTLNNTTNELVKEHIQKCKLCSKVLEDLNTDIGFDSEFDQEEQIDFLKKIKRNQVKLILKIVLIFVIITIILFGLWCYVDVYANFFVDVNDVSVTLLTNENYAEQLLYDINITKYGLLLDYEYLDSNTIILKVWGKFNYGRGGRTAIAIDLDTDIKHIYLQDKKENIREIWNKECGSLL